ncbi:MAG: ABC transporter superfamily protein [Amphiamblys sp. WSBS2006]|nr:MAG: ABC transporter superfamily protein [Amphiamblys sp. WSBS2006]
MDSPEIPPVSICVSNLRLSETESAFPEVDINGVFEGGTITGIVGPSRSGKTAFLDLLYSPNNHGSEPKVLLNNTAENDSVFKNICAIIRQNETFLETLTSHECLQMVADLIVPPDAQTKKARIDAALRITNLEYDQHEDIKESLKKTQNHKQKKKTSIAMKLIAASRVLLLDDPTTGFDGFGSRGFIDMLHGISRSGRTVITTLHQPSSYVFNRLDSVVVISAGLILFWGPREELVSYFTSCGVLFSDKETETESLAVHILGDENSTAKNGQWIEKTIKLHQLWACSEQHRKLMERREKTEKRAVERARLPRRAGVFKQLVFLLSRTRKWVFRKKSFPICLFFCTLASVWIVLFSLSKIFVGEKVSHIKRPERQNDFSVGDTSYFSGLTDAFTQINVGLIIGITFFFLREYYETVTKEVSCGYYSSFAFYFSAVFSLFTCCLLFCVIYSVSILLVGLFCGHTISATGFFFMNFFFAMQTLLFILVNTMLYSMISLDSVTTLVASYFIYPGVGALRKLFKEWSDSDNSSQPLFFVNPLVAFLEVLDVRHIIESFKKPLVGIIAENKGEFEDTAEIQTVRLPYVFLSLVFFGLLSVLAGSLSFWKKIKSKEGLY